MPNNTSTAHRKKKPVSTDTIGHWLKKALDISGVDTSVYGAHSTWSASTSAAKAANVPVETMNAAGWTNAETFRKFYDRQVKVQTPNELGSFLGHFSK